MKKVKEIWKKIDGFEDYEISNMGRVRSMKYNKIKILKPGISNRGYPQISLNKNGTKYTRPIHRLIAEVFIPNPENKSDVNHIDAVKTNNTLDNLEWISHKENMKHAWRNGLFENLRKYGKDHHRSKRIKATYDDGSVQYFDNVRLCSEVLNLNYSSVLNSISQGRTLFGYSFQYINKENENGKK